jgi:UDP-N-acetylglucosamine 2-epimerase
VKLVSVVGARPQFVKASPLSLELRARHVEVLVHTGQHYDPELSDVFFDDLSLPRPDHNLGIGSGSHGKQTGAMLAALEQVFEDERPDAVVVSGDTNSTIAGALAAAKLGIPVGHVEAGLRSFNRRMPEELNRVVTDHLSTWLFAPSDVAREHLAREGITAGVHVVGDVMADSIRIHSDRARARSRVLERERLKENAYYLATIHRAENTDDPARLADIFGALARLDAPVILPLHPRTRKRLADVDVVAGDGIRLMEPQGYLDMLRLEEGAICVLTDSGGVQKEAYYMRTPCVTLREETEWTETVAAGWNQVVGTRPDRIVAAAGRAGATRTLPHPVLYGDGFAARRIASILAGGS